MANKVWRGKRDESTTVQRVTVDTTERISQHEVTMGGVEMWRSQLLV
jgi:hypothetical protein